MGKGSRIRAQRKITTEQKQTVDNMVYNYWKQYAMHQLTTEDMRAMYKAVEDELRENVANKILMAINGGIKIALISCMESHTVGWTRIERDILPLVQQIYDEWNVDYCENGHDVDFAMDRLEQRLNLDIDRTTANRKKDSA